MNRNRLLVYHESILVKRCQLTMKYSVEKQSSVMWQHLSRNLLPPIHLRVALRHRPVLAQCRRWRAQPKAAEQVVPWERMCHHLSTAREEHCTPVLDRVSDEHPCTARNGCRWVFVLWFQIYVINHHSRIINPNGSIEFFKLHKKSF